MANLKGIAAGAVLGTVLGSLAVIFYPQRRQIVKTLLDHKNEIAEKAKEYTGLLLNYNKAPFQRRLDLRSGYLKGGLAGLFLGAGASLFLAPKTGKQLRANISKIYNDFFGKTQEVVQLFKNNSHPFHVQDKLKKRIQKRRVKARS